MNSFYTDGRIIGVSYHRDARGRQILNTNVGRAHSTFLWPQYGTTDDFHAIYLKALNWLAERKQIDHDQARQSWQPFLQHYQLGFQEHVLYTLQEQS